MVFLESWKRRVADFYAHDCNWLFGLSKFFRSSCLGKMFCTFFLGLLLEIFDVKTVNVEFFRSFLGMHQDRTLFGGVIHS